LIAILAGSRESRAEDWIIKYPGQHPSYSFELEPELILVFNRSLEDGPGGGVRGSIPFVSNGFVPSINNSVAFTFGIDKDPLFKGKTINIPIALQWNFWIATHWSVVGEPGVFLQIDDNTHAYFQVWGGARYHFSESVALMMRVTLPNAPAISVGLSFFF
jgi:hypothetical protein